jgi:nucleoside-diphosphate kinase
MREKHDTAGEKEKESEVGGKSEEERSVKKEKERTLLIIKPEGVERGYVGEIISRFEKRGFKIVAMKFATISKEKAERQYEEHRGKDFFPGLVEYISSSATVSMVVEREDAISVAREMAGATNPKEAQSGTIRSDYGIDVQRNVIHASDSEDAAKREIVIHFNHSELLDENKNKNNWM